MSVHNLGVHPARLWGANLLRTAAAAGLLLLVVFLLLAVLGRTGERIAVQICVNVSAVVALAVYCGNTGIVSFGHGAFMTIGAYLSGILTMPAALQRSALPELPAFFAGHELPIWISLFAVLLVGFAFSALSGTAIARLAGAPATISTLGLLIIVHSVTIGARELTRGSQTFYGVPRMVDIGPVLGIALVFIVIARLYRESRWGLFARAARDDEDAARALGISPRRTRFISWTLSGALATVAGALYGHMLGAFSPASFFLSLVFVHVVMLIVGGMSSVGGAVVGVIAVTLLQDTVRQLEGGIVLFGMTMPAAFGLTTITLGIAILLVIRARPQGIVGSFELGPGPDSRVYNRLRKQTAAAATPEKVPETVLSSANLSKRFAGVAAVKAVCFEVPTGQITGLIGPNGAGKSTLVNLLTHQFDADEGAALIHGVDLTRVRRHDIIRHGISRSFQNLRPLKGLTAYENIFVAALSSGLGRHEAASVALRELNTFNLGDVAGSNADSLPYGARKRLEIARALAQSPSILLLDEPAAGMNPAETDDLADRLEQVSTQRGVGILLIDHDLRLVNRLSNRIVVMNHGEKIAEGGPEEVRSNPSVINAYIGRGRMATSAKPQGTQLNPYPKKEY